MPFEPLPSESQIRHLQDIVDAIDRMRQFTDGMRLETFEADERTRLAVERLLKILTEAASRLGREASSLCPEVNWRDVRGFGNFLRHEYDQVLGKSVWATIQEDSPPLLLAVEKTLQRRLVAPGKATLLERGP